MGALLGLGLTSPSCPKAFQQLKTATETRKEVLGDDILTRNANHHFQKIVHPCPEVVAQLAQWNIENMEQQFKSGEPFGRTLESLEPEWNVLLEMSKQLLPARKSDIGAEMIYYLLDLESLDSLLFSPFELPIGARTTRQRIASLVDIIFEFFPLLRDHMSLSADSVRYLQNPHKRPGRDATLSERVTGTGYPKWWPPTPSNFFRAKLSLALAFLSAESDEPSHYSQESLLALELFRGTYTMPQRFWKNTKQYSFWRNTIVLDDEWAPYAHHESSRHTVYVMYIVSVLATYLKAVHGLLDPEDYESSMRHGKMEEDAVFIGYSLCLLWAQMNQQRERSRLHEDFAMNLPSDMPRFAYDWYMRGAFHICHRELNF